MGESWCASGNAFIAKGKSDSVFIADFVTPTAKLTNARLAKAAEYKGRKDAELDRKGRKEDLQAKEQRDSEKSGRASLSKRRVFA